MRLSLGTKKAPPRVRHYLGALVAACSLGGLSLSFGLAHLYSSLEEAAAELRAYSETLRDVAVLRKQAESWLTTTHLAISVNPSFVEQADAQAVRLLLYAEALRGRSPTKPHQEELDAVASSVQTLREGLRIASTIDPEDPRREDRNAELIRGVEALSAHLKSSIYTIEVAIKNGLELASTDLDSTRLYMWRMVWVGGFGYAALVLLLWRWTVRRIIIPLQRLTEESRISLQAKTAFRLVPDGPREIRELTESLSTLVADLVAARDHLDERIRERTHELEQANQAKNDFLANVSHEIRTPMTAILGYARLCQDPDISEEERLRHLQIICASGEHLITVINDILDISRIEAGQMPIQRESCSPFQIVAEVAALIEVPAREKGLELTVRYDGPIPEEVDTDPTRLRQILLNLTTNAIKFTDEGEVTLTVSMRPQSDADELLAFEVSDTGRGMTKVQVAKVFKPFVQADTSTTREFGGTGLGLSISKKLARLLGGDISCQSRPGAGSRFLITIDPGPLDGRKRKVFDSQGDPAQTPARPDGSAPELSLRGRALLVEDVAISRRLVVMILERAGMKVDEAENGLVGWLRAKDALADGEPYDIVFMDMQMPEMDGYEATRKLREEGYDRPIVALTAHSREGERERCLQAGCDEYALKPIDQTALLRLAARLLGRADVGTAAGPRRRKPRAG